MHLLSPQTRLSSVDLRRGLRMVYLEAMSSQFMFVLTSGAFLVGFALELGASNTLIGLLSGIGPCAQAMQIPAVYFVERWRTRKAIAVVSVAVSRLCLFGLAIVPWLAPPALVLPLFLAVLLMHYCTAAFWACAYNSWYRDLVPCRIMGRFYGKRLAGAVAVGAIVGLLGGLGLDGWSALHPGHNLAGYSLVFLIAALGGFLTVFFLLRTPEPAMPSLPPERLGRLLMQPLRDSAFRPLLIFLAAWNLACNFAAPFFAVYLLVRIELSMAWVLGLTVLSQLVNVAFFPIWGKLADRYTNKSVIAASAPLFIFSFLLWPFTTLPETHRFTIALLVGIHVIAGITTAGVNLCAANLALKLAPLGRGGSYLAVNGLICGVAAAVAPVFAGAAADFFDGEQVRMTLALSSSTGRHPSYSIPTVDLSGLDFVFVLAFLLGIYALHRLLVIRETGEVREKIVRDALLSEMWRAVRQVSTAAGVRQMLFFPLDLFRGKDG